MKYFSFLFDVLLVKICASPKISHPYLKMYQRNSERLKQYWFSLKASCFRLNEKLKFLIHFRNKNDDYWIMKSTGNDASNAPRFLFYMYFVKNYWAAKTRYLHFKQNQRIQEGLKQYGFSLTHSFLPLNERVFFYLTHKSKL